MLTNYTVPEFRKSSLLTFMAPELSITANYGVCMYRHVDKPCLQLLDAALTRYGEYSANAFQLGAPAVFLERA